MRRLWLGGIVLGVLALIVAQPARATVYLTAGNDVVAIDETSSAGLFRWSSEDIDHMFQEWFWYRIGPTGGESSIDTISSAVVTGGDPDPTDADKIPYATIVYEDSTLRVQIDFLLTDSGAGKSKLAETIHITNKTSDPLELHFFEYTDFDLMGTPGNDRGEVLSFPGGAGGVPSGAAVVEMQDLGSPTVFSETIVQPLLDPASSPDRWEMATYPSILNSLTDGSPTTLANATSPLGDPGGTDVTYAFQWDVVIQPGDVLQIKKDKEITPEPSTWALFGLGLLGIVGWRRRRKA